MTASNYSTIRCDASPLTQFTDRELWNVFRAGEREAFDLIYTRYFPLLFGYSTQFCRDKALVKDVIQDLFVGLWNKRETMGEVTAIKAYLYTILRNSLVKELTHKKNALFQWDIPDNYSFEVIFSHELLMIDSQSTQQQTKELLKAFGKLSKRQKEVIYLRFYENMDYKSIVEVMSLQNTKSARSLVYKALEELRRYLKDKSTAIFFLPPILCFFLATQ